MTFLTLGKQGENAHWDNVLRGSPVTILTLSKRSNALSDNVNKKAQKGNLSAH